MPKTTRLFFLLIFSSWLSGSANAQISYAFTKRESPVKKSVYSGRIKTDSGFYNKQLSFINRDTALFFLNESASFLSEIPCATFYRVAPINKYYQPSGLVTDYYLDNDSIAASLSYNNGFLDGPCSFYYKNGQIREKGIYAKSVRTGVWEYYYENGGKEKTVRMTDSGAFLIDCFTKKGKMLAENGNGKFEGKVLSGTPTSYTELTMDGPIKNGLPDGKWKLYSNYLSKPLFEETFSSGKFIHGVSTSLSGTQEYDDHYYSAVESVQPMEKLDFYSCNETCTMSGKTIHQSPSKVPFRPLTEISSDMKAILASGKYQDYSGWVLLDIKYDEEGGIAGTSVRLFQQNDAFKNELLAMLAGLNKPGKLNLDGKDTAREKFYVALVEANDVLIPQELIERRKQGVGIKGR